MPVMAAFPLWAWIAFGVFIVLMLALDLFVLHWEAKVDLLQRGGDPKRLLGSASSPLLPRP